MGAEITTSLGFASMLFASDFNISENVIPTIIYFIALVIYFAISVVRCNESFFNETFPVTKLSNSL